MNRRPDEGKTASSGRPAFPELIVVGKGHLPDFEQFKASFREIFARRFFTNHGPLVQELDRSLADYLGVRHVVCVTSGTVALMVALRALPRQGEVILPALGHPAMMNAVLWADCRPVLCDVDPTRRVMTASLVEPLITEHTIGVLGSHLWGEPCDIENLEVLCRRRDLHLVFDAAHAMGCRYRERRIGGFGDIETFSFHSSTVLNGLEGGCLATNNDELAGRIRTVRNFHISESFAKVGLRINGKMSEAQAGLILIGLSGLDRSIAANVERFDAYRRGMHSIDGVRLVVPPRDSNHQYCVVDVAPATGVNAARLVRLMTAENVSAQCAPSYERLPAAFRGSRRFPVTDSIFQRLVQLPMGAHVSEPVISTICEVFGRCVRRAGSEQ